MLTLLLFLSLLAHVLMTFIIGMQTFNARVRDLKSGRAKMDMIAVDNAAYPRRTRLLANNFDNQFQSPTLWYAVVVLAIALKLVTPLFVALSWIFLLSRVAHSIVHTGQNDVRSRARIFILGFVVIVLMWLWLGYQLGYQLVVTSLA